MNTSDFDYHLPPELIAQTPLPTRDASRLLCLSKQSGQTAHMVFSQLPDLLRPGDCLVLNDSRVLKARLYGVTGTGAMVETLLLREIEPDVWDCLSKPGRKTKTGTKLTYGDGLMTGEVVGETEEGHRHIRFTYDGLFLEVLDRLGEMPLPPYIKARLEDPERYQTVYAQTLGSVAAPTAGLHFTPALLTDIRSRGVAVKTLTLHVGLGTFLPVKSEDITDHKMHSEWVSLPGDTTKTILETRKNGGRVIAVGTTVCRSLEAGARLGFPSEPFWTEIFITPGFAFQAIDGLVTNFHLPRSTLLMLVSALAGREQVLTAYKQAVERQYRFFSFGDAMLII